MFKALYLKGEVPVRAIILGSDNKEDALSEALYMAKDTEDHIVVFDGDKAVAETEREGSETDKKDYPEGNV